MIESIIDLGNNFTPQYNDATAVGVLCSSILIPQTVQLSASTDDSLPDDTRFSIAIDLGLFEMCLNLILRFGNKALGSEVDGLMVKSVANIMMAANKSVYRSKKSSKSLSKRQNSIRNVLQMSGSKIPDIPECQEVIRLMNSILSGVKNHSDVDKCRVDLRCNTCCLVLSKKDARFCR